MLHFGLIVLMAIGLPHMRPQDMAFKNPIPVDVVKLSDITNIPEKPRVKAKGTVVQPTVKKEDIKPPAPEPEPEKMEAAAPEPAPTPKAPPAKPKTVAPPKKEELPPLPDLKKIKKSTQEDKTAAEQPKPENDFETLLKTVAKLKESAPKTSALFAADENAIESDKTQEQVTSLSPFDHSKQLSISTLDAIHRQIQPCWNIPAGAKNIENMVVEIDVIINLTGMVTKAEIVDTSRMRSDPFYRTAAESALRAILNPRCSPLNLPADKYDIWKKIRFRFNPADMVR